MAKSQVTTFYSYKGGSGRSMTLANVAWALATNDEKVLAIDWDLEAPGLHRYFHPFLSDPDQNASQGLIDRIWDYVAQLGEERDRKGRFKFADCSDIVQPLEMPVIGGGCLHFIGAGRQDERYSEKVGGLDWNGFYQRFDGEAFIDALIKWARGRYTHVLIDSRTGVADTAGICTTQLPDALVFCLVYNRQSIEGTAAVARSIKSSRKRYNRSSLKMSFVPCRVEERSTVEAARRHTAQRLIGLVDQDLSKIERSLRRAEIRNYPWCAFEEKLAVFEELPDERGSLLDAIHDLTHRITGEEIRIKQIEPEVLSSYWRRAAFDDPRLFDLRAISEQSVDGWKQIQIWLDNVQAGDGERPDWLMALAEAAMGYACRRDGRLPPRSAETFADRALQLARHAYNTDTRVYGTRFALVLEDMAGFLQRAGRPQQALDCVLHAEEIWRRDIDPTTRWRLTRALERRADILDSLGDSEAAIHTYQEMAEIYRLIGRRALPIGSELEPARTQRLLARKLMEAGDWPAAKDAIASAMQLLSRMAPSGRERDVSDILSILITRLQVAVQTEVDAFDKVGHSVLLAANRYLQSESARENVISELFLAQAELLARHGSFEEALSRIDSIPPNARRSPRVALQRSDALMNLGRDSEAVESLLAGIENSEMPLTEEVVERLRRALNAIGQGERIYDVLISSLSKTDDRNKSLRHLLERLLTKARRETKHSVSADDLSEFAAILPALVRTVD
ncbi:KGGVGR-motif variant AAA ATPase [Neorhizobium petrolearium]|uniref:KGGVGR-motif variant AAA ATPase n=1 Tax=Neorhizobium petrolearium TaxID=515361 RepID=UPI003F1482E3